MNANTYPLKRLVSSTPLIAAISASILFGCATAQAASTTWGNTGTDFNTPGNWLLGSVPDSTSNATFDGVAIVQPNLSISATVQGLTFTNTSSGYTLSSASNNTVALTLTNNGYSGSAAVNAKGLAGTTNTINAALNLAGSTATISQVGGGRLVINSVISGANPATVTFATSSGGYMTLGGMNTFSGNATIGSANGITITSIGNQGVAGNLGAGNTINLSDGSNAGTLNYKGSGETTNRIFNLAAATLGGIIDTTGATGALIITSDLTATGVGAKTLTLRGDTAGNTISGKVVDSSGGATAITKAGAGTWILSGQNTHTGQTIIQGGVLSVSSINSVSNGSASSNLGAPTTAANGTISIGATGTTGQLTYTGTGETTDRILKFAGTTGGAVIDQSGTGLLKFSDTGAILAGGGTKTVTLQGSTTGRGEIAGGIQDNTSTKITSLTKAGTGTWTLSGTSTYTGATAVNDGKLIVSGGLTSTGSVSVAAGAELDVTGTMNLSAIISLSGKLSGDGSVGKVNADGTAIVSAGNDDIGTLQTKDFTLASTSQLHFDLEGTNNDLIEVTGNLTLDGVLDINVIGALTPGKHTLFTYTGSLSDNTLELSSAALAAYAGSSIDTSTANQINLLIVPEPATWAMMVSGLGMLITVQRIRRRAI